MKNLPRIGDLVFVQTDDDPEAQLRSRVEDVRDPLITIAPPSDGNKTRDLERSEKIALEWLLERGLGKATATVLSHVDVGVPGICVQLDAEPIVDQRREHARAELILDIDLWLPSLDGTIPTVTGTTLDVSGGGLRAVIPAVLEPDSLVRITLDMPEGKAIDALVRVVAQRDDGVVAMAFHEIVPFERERLIKAVFASYKSAAMVRRPGT
jgi:c-di-GMP-binding flagellar brake protein YcgR